MPAKRTGPRLPLIVVAMAMSWTGPALAETICTFVSTSGEHPVPLDERESMRAIQSRVLPERMTRGDQLAAAGRNLEAAVAYFKVFESIQERGLYYGSERCLSREFYQRAADKLEVVASLAAAELIKRGVYDDRSRPSDRPAALRLLLMSNQYDAFVEHALVYAGNELFENEVNVQSLAQWRIEELGNTRNAGESYRMTHYENDLTPLLDEELAAFDRLAGFEDTLKAHLAPLYPRITDQWLAREASSYDDAIKTDGMIPKNLMFGRATGALEQGIKRLSKHPVEVARLQSRAYARGTALLAEEHYPIAQAYFEIAENDVLAAKANRLAETRQRARLERVEATVKSDIEKMKKTDDEQAAFQEEADEMAREFGFELGE